MEDSMEIPLKSRNKTTYDSTIALLGIYPKETETEKDTCKGVRQGCILSPCLFNFYAEYIMRNARLDEAQAGIKIARRNINNLRHANDSNLMAESEEELKSLLMQVKEESEKVSLKLNIQKIKIMNLVPPIHG